MKKTNYVKITIAFMAILMGIHSLSAQSSRMRAKTKAQEQLKTIKNNGIILRFDTKEPLLKALKERGDMEAYAEEKKALELEVNLIKQVFIREYQFSPVYFSTSLDIVAAKNNPSIIVENTEGEMVTLNKLENKYYVLNPHTVKFSGWGDISGYAIQDMNLENLEKPFPYYVMKHEGFAPLRRSHSEMLEILMEKFSKLMTNNP